MSYFNELPKSRILNWEIFHITSSRNINHESRSLDISEWREARLESFQYEQI
jgi:hypothetical protein